MEEEMARERTKARNLQREIDDLNEANDTLARDNTNLRGQRRAPRESLLGGRRIHSIRNSSPHDDLDSIGTEGMCQAYSTWFLLVYFLPVKLHFKSN